MSTPYVVLEDATFRGPDGPLFEHTNLDLGPGERWAVIGPSGSGKGLLLAGLMGKLSLASGRLRHPCLEGDARFADSTFGVLPPGSLALASMNQHRQLLRARQFHQLRWHGSFSAEMGTVRAFLERNQVEQRSAFAVTDDAGATRFAQAHEREIARFDLERLLDRPLAALSNGELHRLLLARALMMDPRLLIVDEPFAGLDAPRCAALAEILDGLVTAGTGVLLATSRPADLPRGVDHVIEVEAGRVRTVGPRQTVPPRPRSASRPSSPPAAPLSRTSSLVELRDVTVRQGAVTILDGVNLTVRAGEHWALVGPNGSGKSTLLSLILADNPQAFANHVRVAGRQLGPGCGIWDIKAQVGWLSPELDAHYPSHTPLIEVVLSGFAASLGLHRTPRPDETQAAMQALQRLDLLPAAHLRLLDASAVERRLALLARATVHRPPLLVADEPCQELDTQGRVRLLAAIEATARELGAGLLFVTHDPDEIPGSVSHVVALEAGRVVYTGPRTDLIQYQ
jgi:molybdate transport system ATP-binding protein